MKNVDDRKLKRNVCLQAYQMNIQILEQIKPLVSYKKISVLNKLTLVGFVFMLLGAGVITSSILFDLAYLKSLAAVLLLGGPIVFFAGKISNMFRDIDKNKEPSFPVVNFSELVNRKKRMNDLALLLESNLEDMAYDVHFSDDKYIQDYKNKYERLLNEKLGQEYDFIMQDLQEKLASYRATESKNDFSISKEDETLNALEKKFENLFNEMRKRNPKNYEKYFKLYNDILLEYQQKLIEYDNSTLSTIDPRFEFQILVTRLELLIRILENGEDKMSTLKLQYLEENAQSEESHLKR